MDFYKEFYCLINFIGVKPQNIPQIITACASSVAAFLVFVINRSKLKDDRNSALAAMHKDFWCDADFAFVRNALMVDECYEPVRLAILRRLFDRKYVNESDYSILDKVDKYVNFAIRVDAVSRRYAKCLQKIMGRRYVCVENLLFEYWIRQIRIQNRIELFAYVCLFYYVVPVVRSESKKCIETEAQRSHAFIRNQLKLKSVKNGESDYNAKVLAEYCILFLSYRKQIRSKRRAFEEVKKICGSYVPQGEDEIIEVVEKLRKDIGADKYGVPYEVFSFDDDK